MQPTQLPQQSTQAQTQKLKARSLCLTAKLVKTKNEKLGVIQ